MKKTFVLFALCFFFLACFTEVKAQDYKNKSWKFSKCEPSDPEDPELANGKEMIELMHDKSVLFFRTDNTYEWSAYTEKGKFKTDPEDIDYIIMTSDNPDVRVMRFKVAMRNYDKELLLILSKENDPRSMVLVFTR